MPPTDQYVRNASELWRSLAAARGHRVVAEPEWLLVDAGADPGETHILLRAPVVDARMPDLLRLAAGASRPTRVEDPFGVVDLAAAGFAVKRLPTMVRGAAPAPAPPTPSAGGEADVRQVRDADSLAQAERVTIDGYPRPQYADAAPGRMYPPALLEMDRLAVYLATVRDRPVGACLAVRDGHGGGVYWVAVLPGYRRRGVATSLMLAALRGLAGMPVSLCASAAGFALYQRLGFATVSMSGWWRAEA